MSLFVAMRSLSLVEEKREELKSNVVYKGFFAQRAKNPIRKITVHLFLVLVSNLGWSIHDHILPL